MEVEVSLDQDSFWASSMQLWFVFGHFFDPLAVLVPEIDAAGGYVELSIYLDTHRYRLFFLSSRS